MIFFRTKVLFVELPPKKPQQKKKKTPSTTGIWTGTKLEIGYQFKANSVRVGQYRIQNLDKDWK